MPGVHIVLIFAVDSQPTLTIFPTPNSTLPRFATPFKYCPPRTASPQGARTSVTDTGYLAISCLPSSEPSELNCTIVEHGRRGLLEPGRNSTHTKI